MKKIFKLKSFWIVLALVAVAFFLLFFDARKNYQAQTEILVLPQNPTTAINFPYILENLQFLFNSNAEKSSKISVETLEKSGVLIITVKNEGPSQAQNLSRETARKLLASASAHYDIQKDLHFRILETRLFSQNFSILIFSFLESLFFAFILSFFSFYFSFFIFKEKPAERKNLPDIFSWERRMTEKKVFPEIKNWPPKEKLSNEIIKEKKETAPADFTLCKTAAAPDNLPVAMEKEEVKKEEPALAVEEKTPIIREATPEEVKERLNKLLSGKLS